MAGLPYNVTMTLGYQPGTGIPEWLNKGDNAWQLVAATFVGLQSMPGLVVVPRQGGALVESRTKPYLIPGGIDRVARLC